MTSKKMFFALILALSTMLSGQAQAEPETKCHIYLTHLCPAAGANVYFSPTRWFLDVDALANLDAARCSQRALEYANWCQMPGIAAYSSFQVNGRQVIGAYSSYNNLYIFNSMWTYIGILK